MIASSQTNKQKRDLKNVDANNAKNIVMLDDDESSLLDHVDNTNNRPPLIVPLPSSSSSSSSSVSVVPPPEGVWARGGRRIIKQGNGSGEGGGGAMASTTTTVVAANNNENNNNNNNHDFGDEYKIKSVGNKSNAAIDHRRKGGGLSKGVKIGQNGTFDEIGAAAPPPPMTAAPTATSTASSTTTTTTTTMTGGGGSGCGTSSAINNNKSISSPPSSSSSHQHKHHLTAKQEEARQSQIEIFDRRWAQVLHDLCRCCLFPPDHRGEFGGGSGSAAVGGGGGAAASDGNNNDNNMQCQQDGDTFSSFAYEEVEKLRQEIQQTLGHPVIAIGSASLGLARATPDSESHPQHQARALASEQCEQICQNFQKYAEKTQNRASSADVAVR